LEASRDEILAANAKDMEVSKRYRVVLPGP
jgi:gamma-glutamyl phosphate reductase